MGDSTAVTGDARHPLFTDEHEELRRSIRAFVEKELRPHAEEWEEAKDFPDRVFERMGELGFLGLHFDEADGGSGGDYLTMLVLAEEMARCGSGGVSMAVSVQCEYVTPPIAGSARPSRRRAGCVPPSKAGGSARSGITEPGAGSDVAGIATKAIRDGDEYVVNGRKTFITNGCRADFLLLVAKTDPTQRHAGISLLLVDTDTPGFHVTRRLDKVGMLLERHRRARLRGHARPRRQPARRRGQGVHPDHVGAAGRASLGSRRARARARSSRSTRRSSTCSTGRRSASASSTSSPPGTSWPRCRR